MKIGKRLKALRKERSVTLKELAKKSRVQIATLSRIENNVMTGTLASHVALCKALGVSLSDFYHDVESDRKTISFIRQKEKESSFIHPKKAVTEMLTAKVMGKKMMPLLLKIQKGGQTHKEENKPGAEKFIYVLEGKIKARIGKENYTLSKGDSIYFDSSLPHVFKNIGKAEARTLCILTPPSF